MPRPDSPCRAGPAGPIGPAERQRTFESCWRARLSSSGGGSAVVFYQSPTFPRPGTGFQTFMVVSAFTMPSIERMPT